MHDSSRQYLEAEVLTATPQKLRLMLIDGAIRYAHRVLELWDANDRETAVEVMIRLRSTVGELLSGIQVPDTELAQKVASVYLFLLRCLTEAQLKRDRTRLRDVIEILQVERETWQLVCEQMPTAPLPTYQRHGPEEIIAPALGIGGPEQSCFSLDA